MQLRLHHDVRIEMQLRLHHDVYEGFKRKEEKNYNKKHEDL